MQSFYDLTQSIAIFEQRQCMKNAVHICCYQNISHHNETFRVFWLQNNAGQFSFPKTEILSGNNIHRYSESCIGETLSSCFQGYFYFNQEMFIFYNVSKLKRPSHLQMATCWEIINTRQIDKVPIDQQISDFLINYSQLCFLYKKINTTFHSFEIPIVGYSVVSQHMREYVLQMGPVYETFGQYHTFYATLPTIESDQCILKYALILKTHIHLEENATPRQITDFLKEYDSVICNGMVYIQSYRCCYILNR